MMMEQLPLEPRARHSDPETSHRAAAAVKPGGKEMNEAILRAAHPTHAYTAFEIAQNIAYFTPNRWDEGSLRSAVSRLGKRGLLVKDGKGKSPRGQPCDKWRLP